MKRIHPAIALLAFVVALVAPQAVLAMAAAQGLLVKTLTATDARKRLKHAETDEQRQQEEQSLTLANHLQPVVVLPIRLDESLSAFADTPPEGDDVLQVHAPVDDDRAPTLVDGRAYDAHAPPVPPPTKVASSMQASPGLGTDTFNCSGFACESGSPRAPPR